MTPREKLTIMQLIKGVQLVLAEQAAPPPPPPPAPAAAPAAGTAPQPQQPGTDPGQPPQAPQMSDVPVGTDGQPLTVDSLIERLNVIRGGKSFSDPEVYGQLTTLFKQLSNEEKSNIDTTLTNIGKVVINAQEGPGQEQPQQQTPPPPAQLQGQGATPPQAGGAPPPAPAAGPAPVSAV